MTETRNTAGNTGLAKVAVLCSADTFVVKIATFAKPENVVRHAGKANCKNDTTMKNIKIGILLGVIAGIIDVIPMIMQKLTWDANISAFTMWIIVGFLISTIDLKINSIIKGILVAFLVLLPSAILIGWSEPFTLLPIAIMTTILGGLLGFSIHKFTK